MRVLRSIYIVALVMVAMCEGSAFGQKNSEPNQKHSEAQTPSATTGTTVTTNHGAPVTTASSTSNTTNESVERERMLMDRIEKLERRLAELEARTESKTIQPAKPAGATSGRPEESATSEAGKPVAEPQQTTKEDRGILDFLRDTTINLTVDGYYGYNFNKPIGRINLLRAYDVMSNSFSLSQATVVIERAPNVEAGRRFGARLDLMYGQATETVQGNAANEGRPQAYRAIWQAYGTYVAPVGKGLSVDFGKFASSLGYETNYTKDDFNYSRSYYFNFLPFYHLGFRVKYPVNDKLTVMYHVMNGAQQSEDFNGFKSQHFALVLTPAKQFTWQVNYYVGQEQRDVNPLLNPGFASLPTQPGLSTDIIRPVPTGRLHIFDTYATWNITDKLVVAGEGDYVINRVFDGSAPFHIAGGVGYLRYQFTPKFALGGRVEYLSDRGGLFSGVTQALKETTATADFKLAEGFLVRGEWRRDFSNVPFFITDTPGILKKEQNTATLGLVWWWGRKEGSW